MSNTEVTYLGLAGIGLNYSGNMKEIWFFILHLFIAYSSTSPSNILTNIELTFP